MTPPLDDRPYKHIKHVGTRPKNDRDNKCRENLCHIVKDVGCFFEISPEKLYLVYLADIDVASFLDEEDTDDSPFIFWTARENPSLHYESFNMDFGPFNLAVTHQFCSRLKVWLDTQEYRNPDKHIVIVLDATDVDFKLNVTLLVAIAAMVLLGATDDEVIQRLNFFMVYSGKIGEPNKQLVFREKKKFSDVSGYHHSLMTITLEDCIHAFYAALRLKFYDYYEFDHIEYLFYETVISGDLNWIVPGKLLAFAGPSDDQYNSRHPPQFYYHYFKDHKITSIVRLNEAEYQSATFKKMGFEHHDLIFPDGYPPTSAIAARFIKIVDEAKGAVAVHCYAGIGRTGTLIAAYLMARYNFSPQMAVAWTRICRPGSVIGEQQDWLFTKFDQYKDLDSIQMFDSPKTQKNNPKFEAATSQGGENLASRIQVTESKETSTYAAAEKTYGQARALVMTKKQRETSGLERPRTRNRGKKDSAGSSKRTTQDICLDLGKTVPWRLYADDLNPLRGKKNPVTYRLRDGKYEWRVKFPEPDYVHLRHDFRPDYLQDREASLNIDDDLIGKVILDFKHELAETTYVGNKMPNKKARGKPATATGDDEPGLEITRLQPIVMYTLLLGLCSLDY